MLGEGSGVASVRFSNVATVEERKAW